LFDILTHLARTGGGPALEGARVLDAFAGTGALGLEALSRGAAHASFMERDRVALDALARNLEACGETASAEILRVDATRPPAAGSPRDIVFLDPPYGKGLAESGLAALAAKGWFAPDAIAAIEIGAREDFDLPDGFTLRDERRYGAARIVIVTRAPEGSVR
jgi:16S rRNA (guanine966-N2)-methyltransferase